MTATVGRIGEPMTENAFKRLAAMYLRGEITSRQLYGALKMKEGK